MAGLRLAARGKAALAFPVRRGRPAKGPVDEGVDQQLVRPRFKPFPARPGAQVPSHRPQAHREADAHQRDLEHALGWHEPARDRRDDDAPISPQAIWKALTKALELDGERVVRGSPPAGASAPRPDVGEHLRQRRRRQHCGARPLSGDQRAAGQNLGPRFVSERGCCRRPARTRAASGSKSCPWNVRPSQAAQATSPASFIEHDGLRRPWSGLGRLAGAHNAASRLKAARAARVALKAKSSGDAALEVR